MEISSIAAPDRWAHGFINILTVKIMRQILRKIAAKKFENLADISTLADPGVVQVSIDTRVIR